MNTQYLQLAEAVLHQCKDTINAAVGYVELLDDDQANLKKLITETLVKSQHLLDGLGTYRVILSKPEKSTPLAVDTEVVGYIVSLLAGENFTNVKFRYGRVYRLRKACANVRHLRQATYLLVYIAALSSPKQLITLSSFSRRGEVWLRFELSKGNFGSIAPLINNHAKSSSYLNLQHEALTFTLLKLVLEQIGARLYVRKTSIAFIFPIAKQLKLTGDKF